MQTEYLSVEPIPEPITHLEVTTPSEFLELIQSAALVSGRRGQIWAMRAEVIGQVGTKLRLLPLSALHANFIAGT